LTQGRQIGILVLEGEKAYQFTEQEMRPCLLMLGRLATAVENRRLFEQTQQRAAELATAKEAAEVANRAKSEFLSNMSHELRTPLNGILGYAQILKRDSNLSDQQKHGLNIIQQSGEHLLTLITDILDIAKIEASKLELHPTEFHLPSFLQDIARICRRQAEQKDLSFTYEALTPLPPGVRADEPRLRQVLLNLLGNAIKFTDTGGVTFRVSVASDQLSVISDQLSVVGNNVAEKQGSRDAKAQEKIQNPKSKIQNLKFHFEVVDTGSGIAPEQMEKIFSPFEQIGNIYHRAEGTGLGLAISQQLVQLMGSTLYVKSELGQGSAFWFEVELPVVEVEVGKSRPATRNIIGYKGPLRKVLVADDKAHNRSMLLNILEPLGFEVIEAEDGQEGVTKAQASQPDMILMDLVMPVKTGTEAIQEIRRLSSLSSVVIVATSASVFNEDQQQSMLAGYDAFLAKPVNKKKLLKLLETHLELEWIYKESADEAAKTAAGDQAEAEESLVPPPPEEMDILYDLAMRGNMRRLRERADYLEQLDKKFIPFACKLRQLARNFEDEQILALVEQYMEASS
jgi:signal transduction histidine kinase/DNA-binding NarL/FixJ family response regulator